MNQNRYIQYFKLLINHVHPACCCELHVKALTLKIFCSGKENVIFQFCQVHATLTFSPSFPLGAKSPRSEPNVRLIGTRLSLCVNSSKPRLQRLADTTPPTPTRFLAGQVSGRICDSYSQSEHRTATSSDFEGRVV